MNRDQIQIHYREEYVGIRTYKTKYIAEITHIGLNDYKVFSSDNKYILQNKVNSHVAKLNEKWSKIVEKNNIVRSKEELVKDVERRNKEAVSFLNDVENILLYTLDVNDAVDWDSLKDKSRFSVPYPGDDLPKIISAISKPAEPAMLPYPQQPHISAFEPKLTFIDGFIKSKKDAKLKEANSQYQKRMDSWRNECEEIDNKNNRLKENYSNELIKYNNKVKAAREANEKKVEEWSLQKAEFLKRREEANSRINLLRQEYLKKEQGAVLEYCELVLNNSNYPESFPKNFELDYNPETKILVIEYSLPSIDQLPTIAEVKLVKGEVKEYPLSDVQSQKLFDATMYKITLRTIHEIFESDIANAIDAVSFNGWVNAVNKANGKRENNCILTIQVNKEEFMKIDLRHVDPKTCFKNLKGVGSSKLSGLTPVQPILQINRNDSRFINSYDVADSLDSSTNLASMDWEDFEHLIREVFGKEFSSGGGEVNVTKASRDGGVDAIAFDPDPIRGGKIVIQAKRYTNTVSVSAVRDLYGTVLNEGATKGILVTTADFGPDSYEFIKGKPLTLMNGANLLYLLGKHGHQAKIDLKEARQAERR